MARSSIRFQTWALVLTKNKSTGKSKHLPRAGLFCYCACSLDRMKKDDSIWLVGASSGIGAALAVRLLNEGHSVALSARREDAMRQVVESVESGLRERAFIHTCDVSDERSVVSAYEGVKKDMGIPGIVIANAGIYTPESGDHLSASACKQVLDVNLYGATTVLLTAMPDMIKRGSGTLAAVASVAGYRGLPGAAPYCAGKAGLIAFTESLRFDLEKSGVGVAVINPGFVKSRLTDKNRFPMPFIISAEKSADYIYRGLMKDAKEIHYPPVFSWFMKTLRVIPYPLYEAVVRRARRNEQ